MPAQVAALPVAMPSGEFVAGTVAGITSKMVDFPFDTIKVRLQAANCEYASTRECIRAIARQDGLRGFYSGIAAPIGGTAAINATLFTSYAAAVRVLHPDPTTPAPLLAIGVAGGFGGVCASCLVTPMELVKCRVQNSAEYTGVVDCVRKTLRREGPAGLFRGHVATLWRGAVGNGAWMVTYEAALEAVVPRGGSRHDVQWYGHGFAGGMAGLVFWGLMLPVDTVKTRMQTDPVWQQKGFVRAFRDAYATAGVSGLYKGMAVTSLRAFLGNGTIFMMYELVRKRCGA